MNIVCVRDYITSVCKYTAGKTYQVLHDSYTSIQIIDDDGFAVALTKETIVDLEFHLGMSFDYHFKYLSEVRNDKLESLGI
jgi:hypothetical protein